MQPIQINVKVTIGMENALLGIISKMMGNREAAPEAVSATKPKKQAKQVEDEPQPKPEVENSQATEPEEAVAPQTEQPATEAAAPAERPAQNKEYTEVDVRAAMDRTRDRIEGDNWSENTGSDGYKKWHKALNAWFKNTSALFGAEKPSLLPDSESRAKFIACCDAVYVENGELVEKPAF